VKRFIRIFLFGTTSLILFVFLANVLISITTRSYIYNDIDKLSTATVALVPGAAVSEGGILSPIFIDRLDTAVSLYKVEKVAKILVSGDNSTDYYNEVNPARLYLINKGVHDADIYLDHAGFDTYSSMYRARDIFKVSSVIISTQSFHLPRSIFIARRLGLDASGINADVGNILFKNYLREVLANEKAIFELIFQVKPKFLGEEIPIIG
jgi:SanA protein